MVFIQYTDKCFIVIDVVDDMRDTRGGKSPNPTTTPHSHSITNTITIIPAKTHNYHAICIYIADNCLLVFTYYGDIHFNNVTSDK